MENFKIIFYILFLQYITGYKTYIILWFVQILLIFTFFFEIIFYCSNKHTIFIFNLLIIISYWLQYSEINYQIFSEYKPHLRSISHIAEMMPIASTGITLASIDILKKLEKIKVKTLFFCIVVLFFTYNYNLFGEFRGFPYSGIKQNIAGICLFIFFALIPFQIIDKKILKVIKIITSHTGGIYYFQAIMEHILSKINYLKYNDIFKCFLIYLFGYLICFLGSKIFKKNRLKYLFI